jgi:hypothetical protein
MIEDLTLVKQSLLVGFRNSFDDKINDL